MDTAVRRRVNILCIQETKWKGQKTKRKQASLPPLEPIATQECESAFAPYVGFGVLMTSKLGTNVILMRYVAAISPMKDLKS